MVAFEDEDEGGSGDEAGLQDDGLDMDDGGKAYTMNCRMYANQFPEIDDVVMVQVRSIAEMGAYVCLLEYNNIEGMILLSELSRRRIRSVNKLIRVGKQEVCMVLRVDKEKGYIDLSKRRVSAEDVAKCDERFNKSKAVHSIMRHISEVKAVDTRTAPSPPPLTRTHPHPPLRPHPPPRPSALTPEPQPLGCVLPPLGYRSLAPAPEPRPDDHPSGEECRHGGALQPDGVAAVRQVQARVRRLPRGHRRPRLHLQRGDHARCVLPPPRPPASSPSRLVIDRRPPVQPRLLLSPPQPSSSSPPPPSISSAPSISSLLSPSAGLDANLRKAILDDVCKRLTPTAIKIRADIEVTCFHYEGINAIRSALLKGAELAAPEVPPRPVPPRPPRSPRAPAPRKLGMRHGGHAAKLPPPPQRAPPSPSSAA